NPSQYRHSWMQSILPYMEEAALYENFTSYMRTAPGTFGSLHFPGNTTIVPPLVCPSDSNSPKLTTYNPGGGVGQSQGLSGNIVACAASTVMNPGGHANSMKL